MANKANDMTRQGKISRKTKETEIDVSITIDGTGSATMDTGIGLF